MTTIMDKIFDMQPICNNTMCLHYDHKLISGAWNKTKCTMFDVDPCGDKYDGFSVLDCGARKNYLKMNKTELVQSGEVSIQKNKLSKLKNGYKQLYILFHNSIIERRVVTRLEIFSIYKSTVAKGKSYVTIWDREKQLSVEVLKDWNEFKWNQNFNLWFIHALGSLLKRGYLRVVPAIDLSLCNEQELTEIGVNKSELTCKI